MVFDVFESFFAKSPHNVALSAIEAILSEFFQCHLKEIAANPDFWWNISEIASQFCDVIQ